MASLNPALMGMLKNAKNKYSRQTSKTVKLKEGKTKLRLLLNPTLNPNGKFWRDLGVHWIKPDLNAKPVAVVGCRDHTYEQPCELCTAIEKAIATASDDDSIKLYKEWKARRSVLVQGLVRSGPDASEDPQIIEMTPTTFGTMISIIEEYSEAGTDPLSLSEGIDFIVERKGKGLDTEYVVMAAPKSDPVKKAVLDKMVNVDEFIEREYFRGDETKALNCIAQVTGLALGAIAAPRGTALLTSRGKVAEADVDDVPFDLDETPAKPAVKAATKPAAAKPAPAPVATAEDDDLGGNLPAEEIDDILADLDNL